MVSVFIAKVLRLKKEWNLFMNSSTQEYLLNIYPLVLLVVWRSVGNESLRVPYRQLVARELMNSEDVVRVNC